jgi:hypothetical protein
MNIRPEFYPVNTIHPDLNFVCTSYKKPLSHINWIIRSGDIINLFTRIIDHAHFRALVKG